MLEEISSLSFRCCVSDIQQCVCAHEGHMDEVMRRGKNELRM